MYVYIDSLPAARSLSFYIDKSTEVGVWRGPFFFFFFFQISKDSGATGILIQTVFSIYILYLYPIPLEGNPTGS